MKKEDEDAVACVMDTLHGKLSTIGRDPCGGSLGLIQLFNLRALVSLLSTTSCYGFFCILSFCYGLLLLPLSCQLLSPSSSPIQYLVKLLYYDEHFDMVIQRVFNIVTIKGLAICSLLRKILGQASYKIDLLNLK
jgi:hypothetical protein